MWTCRILNICFNFFPVPLPAENNNKYSKSKIWHVQIDELLTTNRWFRIIYGNLMSRFKFCFQKSHSNFTLNFVKKFFWKYLVYLFRWCLKCKQTGLNIKIGIVQKLYEWPGLYFAKMILQSGDHFGKRTAWSIILIFSPVQIIMAHPLLCT